jgi:hypothetical protein
MRRVNGYISDLFFNYQHDDPIDEEAVRNDADEFLMSIEGLFEEFNIDSSEIPSIRELVKDFFDRL